ncbi:FAD-dependent monooxygenase [Nonomuraea monospora]|uniref:FAD-dependent monooxygenase n=1 Tax=Nonomuraea monospora TaxID=568818 RepID=A0ABN3CR35_9ACTN
MDADVIIVGAGPVGLLLAAELRLGGVRPVVIERLDKPGEEQKARGIGPLATEALWRRGLGPLLEQAQPGGARDLARDHGSSRGHFANIHKLVPDGRRPGTQIWQPELERILSGHAEALGVAILRGHRLVALDDDGGAVAVVVATGRGERRLRAPFLVGCDGGRSTVRKLAGFAFPGTPALLRTIAARVRFAGDIPAAGRYESGTFMRGGTMAGVCEPAQADEPGGTVAAGGPGSTVAAGGPGGTVTGGEPTADEPHRPVTAGELAAAIRRVTGADVVIEEIHDGRRFGDQARQADTYRHGRVLLAGDAAHVHSPSGGQGLNLGLMDAMNLGWKLAAVIRGDTPETLLDTYTTERHPAGEAVLRNTRAQSALLAPGPHVGALRDVIEELMDLPAVNRYFTELLSAVNLRYELPYPARDQAGRHCPDLEVVSGGGAVSRLHEHMRAGRGLLLLTPGTRDLARYAAGRVEVEVATAVTGMDALLLRPDAVIAWTGDDRASLTVALDTWFGEPR